MRLTELSTAGVPGIKYLDQGSRGAGTGTKNYVVFDQNLINIIKKYGIAGLGAFPAGSQFMHQVDHDPFPAQKFARGGRAQARGPAAQRTVPETRATLLAQQHQLINGQRAVQMFPRGTRQLPLPHGMSRVATAAGVFHFDPKKISAAAIKHASAAGRENEILGLGPVSKAETLHRIARGETPAAVVERRPNGVEVRAAAGTLHTVPHQIRAMMPTKSPGSRLSVESPASVISRRQT